MRKMQSEKPGAAEAKRPEKSKKHVKSPPSKNPFVGIVPFNEVDQGRFFGRNRAIETTIFHIKQFQLTILQGPSGSGKTSLIRAGILPRLRQFRVGPDRAITGLPLIVRNWGVLRRDDNSGPLSVNAEFCGILDKENNEAISSLLACIASKDAALEWLWKSPTLLRAFQKDCKDFESVASQARKGKLAPEEMISKLSNKCNGVVLVFDQFEEILRSSRAVAEEVCNLIHRLLRIPGVRVMLSMRPEHVGDLNALRFIEIGTGSVRTKTIPLDEMGLDDAVTALNGMGEAAGITVDAALISAVRDLRTAKARQRVGGDAHMFCCQAVVSEMWDSLQRQRSNTKILDIAAFNEAFNTAVDIFMGRAKIDLFAIAIKNTFQRSFESNQTLSLEVAALHRHIAARAAPRLSSAGFKTPQGQADLFEAILGEGLNGDSDPRRDALWTSFKGCFDRLEGMHILKKYDVSSDPLWELRHDRIGDPLIEWANDIRDTFDDCVAAPHGCRGTTPIEVALSGLGSKTNTTTISEKLWRGCYVRPEGPEDGHESASLTRMKFIECDFSGTAFDRIEFRGCEFHACRLDGALFKRCTFVDCRFDGRNGKGFTIGFLACTFKGENNFLNWDVAQIAFSADSSGKLINFIDDVHFSNVKLQLAWFGDAAPGLSGKLEFSDDCFMRWCSWDRSFDALIRIPDSCKHTSALDELA